MKFTVELEDFYIEEGELNETLVRAIKKEIVQSIRKKTKEDTEKKIADQVQNIVQAAIQSQIDESISLFVETGVITVQGKEIQIADHLKNVFQNNHGWSSPTSKMESIAKRFGDDLKAQYNNIFASKIVQTMHQQGFLKDDMAKILLGEASK